MDYEFLRDITGVVKVRMSMGHEAVGHWFNEEVKENLALLDEVEAAGLALTFLFSFLPPPTLFFFLAAAIITLMALQRKTLWITNFCATSPAW